MSASPATPATESVPPGSTIRTLTVPQLQKMQILQEEPVYRQSQAADCPVQIQIPWFQERQVARYPDIYYCPAVFAAPLPPIKSSLQPTFSPRTKKTHYCALLGYRIGNREIESSCDIIVTIATIPDRIQKITTCYCYIYGLYPSRKPLLEPLEPARWCPASLADLDGQSTSGVAGIQQHAASHQQA